MYYLPKKNNYVFCDGTVLAFDIQLHIVTTGDRFKWTQSSALVFPELEKKIVNSA